MIRAYYFGSMTEEEAANIENKWDTNTKPCQPFPVANNQLEDTFRNPKI